ncbi:hypothetical protein CBS470a_012745 [Colletotrichum nupharicola]|nr:hypothetical protein CBS470a_012745 [Colletotrichum nupharicola]
MRSVSLALLAAAGIHFLSAAAAPANNTNVEACADPLIRHEWRQLSLEQRLDYIDSIKCLMALPSEGNDLWPGAKSRYDDFQGMHIYMTKQVHFNGPFLPWHRWMLYLFESELRTKCDFKGTLPYWDMGLDNTAEGFAKSPVFENVYGVGGNGPYIENITDPEEFPVQKPIEIPERSGCVQEGPFANITVPMGLGYSVEYTPHCLRRDFSLPIITSALSDEVINRTLSATSFDEFNLHIQGYSMQVSGMTLHAGMHLGIGGAVGDMDIGGPDIIWAYPFNFFGDVAYENITLQYPMSFPNFSGDMTVAEMMDIQGGPFCYEYK